MNVRIWYEIVDLPVSDDDPTLTKSREFPQTDAKHQIYICSQEVKQKGGVKYVRMLVRHMRELEPVRMKLEDIK